MAPRVTSVEVLPPYAVRVGFEDGTSGVLDLHALVFERPTGVFADLRDQALFAQVWVDPELETIAWPNGADIDPDVLYQRAHRSARV